MQKTFKYGLCLCGAFLFTLFLKPTWTFATELTNHDSDGSVPIVTVESNVQPQIEKIVLEDGSINTDPLEGSVEAKDSVPSSALSGSETNEPTLDDARSTPLADEADVSQDVEASDAALSKDQRPEAAEVDQSAAHSESDEALAEDTEPVLPDDTEPVRLLSGTQSVQKIVLQQPQAVTLEEREKGYLYSTWEPVNGADGYQIDITVQGGMPRKLQFRTYKSTFLIGPDRLPNIGSLVTFTITPYLQSGNEIILGEQSASAQTVALRPVVQPKTEASFTLKWNRVDRGQSLYEIFAVNRQTKKLAFVASTFDNQIEISADDRFSLGTYRLRTYFGYKTKGIDRVFTTTAMQNSRPAALPAVPLKAAEGTTGSTIQVSWDAIPMANRYDLFLKKPGESSYRFYRSTTHLKMTVSGLKEATSYDFWLRGRYVNERFTNYAPREHYTYFTATTLKDLPAPTGLTFDEGKGFDAVLSWNPVQGASRYQVFFYNDQTKMLQYYGSTQTPHIRLYDLKPDKGYQVMVKGVAVYEGQSRPSLNKASLTFKTTSLSDPKTYPAVSGPVIYLSPSNQPANRYWDYSTTEQEQMEKVGLRVYQNLQAYNVTAYLPDYEAEAQKGWRKPGPLNDEAIKKTGRPTDAAKYKADFYLAIHSNAMGRRQQSKHTGTLAFYHPDYTLSKQVSLALLAEMNAISPFPNLESAGGHVNGMVQFGGSGYGEVRSPGQFGIPAVLLETNYHDYAPTGQWIKSHIDDIGDAITRALVKVFNLKKKSTQTTRQYRSTEYVPIPLTDSTDDLDPHPIPNEDADEVTGQVLDTRMPILNGPTATLAQAKAWAKAKRAADWFVDQADLFWQIAKERGVDPAVAYAQAALETGYGKYGGAITVDFHNTCGLKRVDATGDEPHDHMIFDSWETGITAHVDHLALYAGKTGYPKPMISFDDAGRPCYTESQTKALYTPDTRHFSWLFGRAKTMYDLGGKWAPSKAYGELIENLVRSMRATLV